MILAILLIWGALSPLYPQKIKFSLSIFSSKSIEVLYSLPWWETFTASNTIGKLRPFMSLYFFKPSQTILGLASPRNKNFLPFISHTTAIDELLVKEFSFGASESEHFAKYSLLITSPEIWYSPSKNSDLFFSLKYLITNSYNDCVV